MSEPIRFFTFDGQPPNGGVPFAQPSYPTMIRPTAAPANSGRLVDHGPPNGGIPYPMVQASAPAPQPPPYVAAMIGYPTPSFIQAPAPQPIAMPIPVSAPQPIHMPTIISAPTPQPISMPTIMPAAVPQPVPAAQPEPARLSYEPPGQEVEGSRLDGDGWTYIAHAENTTIQFLGDGVRPCDFANGYFPQEFPYSKHKVPCNMTVRELAKQLGCPEGAQMGLTEMVYLGGDRFAEGDSFTQGGEASTRTLGEVGWTQERGDGNPVWLVVKRG